MEKANTLENPFKAFNILVEDTIVIPKEENGNDNKGKQTSANNPLDIKEVADLTKIGEDTAGDTTGGATGGASAASDGAATGKSTSGTTKGTDKKGSTKDVATEEEESEEVTTTKKEETEQYSEYGQFALHLADKGIIDIEGIEIEDSLDGLETSIQNTISKGVDAYKASIPEPAREYLEYLEAGGDPTEYIRLNAEADYSNVDIKDDEDLQKSVVKDYLLRQDYTEKEANETLQEYEDSGILAKQAARSLTKLKDLQQKEKQALVENQKESQIQAEQKRQQDLAQLQDDIKNREDIRGFKLSKVTRDKLFDHITKPIDKRTGETQFMLNNRDQKKAKDTQLLIAYLDMVGWDMSKLETKVETKLTSKLKSALNNYSDGNTKMKGGTDTNTQIETTGPDFSLFRKAIS